MLILQRYYFESESQHGAVRLSRYFGCCLSYKDTILKANHSSLLWGFLWLPAVAYPTKILFWKRITAEIMQPLMEKELLLILQRYYFESESQHMKKNGTETKGCCLSYKDTILKANHSKLGIASANITAVAYPTKILFWKRITASWESHPQTLRCCLSYKDTILKANHSVNIYLIHLFVLLLILQRYYFESESQLSFVSHLISSSCCLSYKDTILKANHSMSL